uniref:NAD(P)H dehydrogenase (quinone) n=1 Tax=Oryza meridionalis TaxID=40149 RepID=A0A0E0E2V2_9ORYZ
MEADDGGEDVIPVVDPDGLPDTDGFFFGFPARFGAMPAPRRCRPFFDSTGPLCRHQRLASKPAGLFVSTGTQFGGQETTARLLSQGGCHRRQMGARRAWPSSAAAAALTHTRSLAVTSSAPAPPPLPTAKRQSRGRCSRTSSTAASTGSGSAPLPRPMRPDGFGGDGGG